MKVIIRLIFVIALAMALVTITLMITMKNSTSAISLEGKNSDFEGPAAPRKALLMPSKRLSRFLAAQQPKPRNPNAADHCRKDNEICVIQGEAAGRNFTCCNNKCMDLGHDAHNCGACKKKCLPFEACCNGQCINLSYDKRHCGVCHNKCSGGKRAQCIYGMCDYA